MENTRGNTGRVGYGPLPATARREGRALSPSRASVLEALQGCAEPATLAHLAEATGLHPNTLREHLEALVARGLAARVRATPQGRGRPAWLYEATDPDVSTADSEYAGLAAALAAHLHRTSEHPREDAVAAGETWGHDLARRSGRPNGTNGAAARRKLVSILDEVGFSPESDERATTVRLTRCPLLETAKAYPDVVCGVHLGIVRGALDEYGTDSTRTALEPFSEPGACRLHLLTRDRDR